MALQKGKITCSISQTEFTTKCFYLRSFEWVVPSSQSRGMRQREKTQHPGARRGQASQGYAPAILKKQDAQPKVAKQRVGCQELRCVSPTFPSPFLCSSTAAPSETFPWGRLQALKWRLMPDPSPQPGLRQKWGSASCFGVFYNCTFHQQMAFPKQSFSLF